jgi:hypothetical protein
MRRIVSIIYPSVFALLTGCSSTALRAPEWQRNFDSSISHYQQRELEADRVGAQRAFRAAERAASAGADVGRMALLLLNACLMDSLSTLNSAERSQACVRFRSLPKGSVPEEYRGYAALISGEPLSTTQAVPNQYQKLAYAISTKAGSYPINDTYDPLSHIAAIVMLCRYELVSIDQLEVAADRARMQGWRFAHVELDKHRVLLLRRAGRENEAKALEERLALFAARVSGAATPTVSSAGAR